MEHTDDLDVCLACVIENTEAMLKDRGYINAVELPAELPEELANLGIVLRQKPTGEAIMAVVFDNVGVTTARAITEYMAELPDSWHMVAICNVKFTPDAVKALREIDVERFKTEELSSKKRYNRMVPTNYRVLSDQEKACLGQTIGDFNRLPAIRPQDFMQRYYNAPAGSVYEIEVRNGQLPMRIKHRMVRDDMD
jgi:DNA-directed RNA polymerase subunit H (RpoH/RPB5)